MKQIPVILLAAFLVTITALALWLGHLAWRHLPMPAPPIAAEFLTAAWFGGLFLGVIQFAKHKLDP